VVRHLRFRHQVALAQLRPLAVRAQAQELMSVKKRVQVHGQQVRVHVLEEVQTWANARMWARVRARVLAQTRVQAQVWMWARVQARIQVWARAEMRPLGTPTWPQEHWEVRLILLRGTPALPPPLPALSGSTMLREPLKGQTRLLSWPHDHLPRH